MVAQIIESLSYTGKRYNDDEFPFDESLEKDGSFRERYD